MRLVETFENQDYLCLVLNQIPGKELLEIIALNYESLSIKDKKGIFLQLCQGITIFWSTKR